MRRLVVPLLLTLVGASCGLSDSAPPPPAVGEARAHLDELVAAGLARDFVRLCDLGGPMCERLLDGNEHLAPAEAPRIADVSVHQPERIANGFSSGGVLFVLCGRDAVGAPYESELLVSRNPDGSLHVVGPVWWTGIGVQLLGPDGGADVGGPPEAARCG